MKYLNYLVFQWAVHATRKKTGETNRAKCPNKWQIAPTWIFQGEFFSDGKPTHSDL